MGAHTYPTIRRSQKLGQHGNIIIPVSFVVILAIAAFTLPIFKSGGKTGLTFAGFIRNHTIWADPGPEYVPQEAYMTIFNN